MRKSWLLFVCLGTLAWGQAQPAPASRAPAPNAATKPATAAPAAVVAENAAVITIKGVACPEYAPAATKSSAAAKTATVAKKPAACVITRAAFEKLTAALQPGPAPLTVVQKHQLASQLPGLIALSQAAKKKGLDKSSRFQERVKIDKMSILSNELKRTVQQEADKVPQEEIATYYKENPEAFEQFSVDRLFIPKMKQQQPEEDKEEAKEEAKEETKLTEEQQKTKDDAEKAKQEKGEQELTELADKLQKQAAAGEDFTKLQKEAFEVADVKVENPTINLPKVRRTGLPSTHAAVFELKVGEVSAVISDQGGHYIYKMVSKEVLPLDQVKDEIHNKLRGEHLREMMDKFTKSYQSELNEAYFAVTGPSGAPLRPRMPKPPGPQGAAQEPAPPAANTPAQPAATPAARQTPAAPPAKPN